MPNFLVFMESMNFFTAVKQYPEIFGYVLIAAIIIGIISPLIGSVVIVRRLSFIADTLSHFSLAGVYFGVLISNIWNFHISPINTFR